MPSNLGRCLPVLFLTVGVVCFLLGALYGHNSSTVRELEHALSIGGGGGGTSGSSDGGAAGGGTEGMRRSLEALQTELRALKSSMRSKIGGGSESASGSVGGADHAPNTPKKDVKEIVSLASGMCMDYNAYQYKEQLKTWSCHQGQGGPFQFWRLTRIGQIRSDDRLCVDAGGLKEGDVARVLACDDNKASQKWTYVLTTSDTGQLRSDDTGMCLHMSTTNDVEVRKCMDSCAQKWQVRKADRGAPVMSTSLKGPEAKGKLVRSHKAGRILCWVLTMPAAYSTKATAVNNTWGRDCDILLFASTAKYPGLNVVELDLGAGESRDVLWPKSQHMWMHVYQHYLDKADWFIKADDDTYVVFPYLHEYLATLDTNQPIHLGRRLHLNGGDDTHSYYSGGAGIILSKEAVRRLGDAALKDPSVWAGPIGGAEDYLTSQTLRKVGVFTQDTRAPDGQRFMLLGSEPEHTYVKETSKDFWMWTFSKDAQEGAKCCSKHWVADHYVPWGRMYTLDLLRRTRCQVATDRWPYLEFPESLEEYKDMLAP